MRELAWECPECHEHVWQQFNSSENWAEIQLERLVVAHEAIYHNLPPDPRDTSLWLIRHP